MGSLLRFKLEEFIGHFKLRAFVETGTARGDSLAYAASRPEFEHLLSCEIMPLLAAGAGAVVFATGSRTWTAPCRCPSCTVVGSSAC